MVKSLLVFLMGVIFCFNLCADDDGKTGSKSLAKNGSQKNLTPSYTYHDDISMPTDDDFYDSYEVNETKEDDCSLKTQRLTSMEWFEKQNK